MSSSEPFAVGLQRFVASLTRTEAGGARSRHEVDALLAATRDMLNRISHASVEVTTEPSSDRGIDPAPLGTVFRAGQTVAGVFTVTALINRGGMGELYRVRHRELGTDHALKVLQPGWAADANVAALLRNEARLLLMVRHDAVVGGQGLLFDGDGRPVVVMDYLHGPSLAQVLRRGPLTLEGVVLLGTRLLAGLEALHGRGIVHGDLSPANIVLCDEQPGGATLVDLGVARLLTELRGPHAGLDFAGKYAWAAPEQLDLAAPPDTRSDLYSLGLLLAAASGAPLPMGGTEAEALRHRKALPPLDAVPAPLQPVIAALLQFRPATRPATAAAAATLLASVQQARPRGLFSKWSGS